MSRLVTKLGYFVFKPGVCFEYCIRFCEQFLIKPKAFFSLTMAPSLRARIAERWATEDLLGSSSKSKTIKITDFDLDPREPKISVLVLRCWMLHRGERNDFCKRNKSRQRWFD